MVASAPQADLDAPEELAARLRIRLSEVGFADVSITDLHRLSGGASRQTWAFRAVSRDNATRRLILRRDPLGEPRPEKMALEAHAITLAGKHSVPVPEIVDSSSDSAVLGSPYLIMSHVDGETIARKILRDDEYAAARSNLGIGLGEALGRIHSITDATSLDGFEKWDPLHRHRLRYEQFGFQRPVVDLALRWLEERRPASDARVTLVHGDFRMGNIIVDESGLAAVLDWENVHIGDPMEDLGYLCIRAWRFGGPCPVAGVGTFDDLFRGYEVATGVTPDPYVVRWWQVVGTLSWALGCMFQVDRHLRGTTRSVELAAIGRRIAEQEHDLLRLIKNDLSGRTG
jgi:aminoglycoside phosphotransferase (APT) family kinase protein